MSENPEQHMDSLFVTIRPTSEVTVKAPRTRTGFLRKLRLAVKDALQRAGFRTEVRVRANRVNARLEPRAEAGQAEAVEALTRVFGIGSFSFLEKESTADLDEIVRTGQALFRERVQGRTYAVRCRRSGNHPFTSVEVERALGAALNPGATVNLTDPEVRVEVEVDQDRAWFFSARHRGAGGLPPGTGGHALALLSGGYDSVVGAWQLMKRGVLVDFVHFRLGDLPSEGVALEVAKVMTDRWAQGSRPDAHVVDLRGAMDEMRAQVEPSLWQVSLKRLMVRAADGVADALEEVTERTLKRGRVPIDALITGEAVGQVSSQTLSNLRTIDAAADRPVLRPLIGFDKTEIIELAERIGTAELSARAIEECNITPVSPATTSRSGRLEQEEGGMRYEALAAELERVRSGASRVSLRTLEPGGGLLPKRPATPAETELTVTELPPDAVLLDCRPAHMRGWTPDWPEVQTEDSRLSEGRKYVTFCPRGQRSLAAAERLRADGFDVLSFGGGEAALKKHLESLPAPDIS